MLSPRPTKSHGRFDMKKTTSCPSSIASTPDDSGKSEKKKKSILPKIFSSKKCSRDVPEDILQSDGTFNDLESKIAARRLALMEATPTLKRSFSESRQCNRSVGIEGLNLSNFDQTMAPATIIQDIRVFVGTWNVGGKNPDHGLNLEEFLQVEGSSDLYVLGFQEIVPLSAGNVLVAEDSEPASRWLALISQALNKPKHERYTYELNSNPKNSNSSKDQKSNLFDKPSLRILSKNLRADSSQLKACNCPVESPTSLRRRPRNMGDVSSIMDGLNSIAELSATKRLTYRLVASKQMVGLFLSVWARKELVQHIGHLKTSCIGRGIMGRLGNKGCISIRFTLHQTSFCFVCSHLASGEKEGDELKRNADVAEILKSTEFSSVCSNPNLPLPEKIMDHDRILWLGDLNYRVSLSYDETRVLLEGNNWDALLQKDQLIVERGAGRVFNGWQEGRISFAPTYKYSHNSDSYAGEKVKSKKKRRTPAWCDRILWRGNGIEQLSYVRGESRFSDHRPVCAVFAIEVEKNNSSRFRKGYSCAGKRLLSEDGIPDGHSSYGI